MTKKRKPSRKRKRSSPNGLEKRVASLAPKDFPIYFTGNRKVWVELTALGKHKNPDFIIPLPGTKRSIVGFTKVVEVFGDWWHSERFTGQDPKAHERELVQAYAVEGIKCLVLWESDIKKRPRAVRERLRRFIKG